PVPLPACDFEPGTGTGEARRGRKGSLCAKPAGPVSPSSKRPRGRGPVGGVRAEGPGFDARREMATEDGVVITDPVQRRLDGFRHGPSGPLAGGSRLTVTAAEADRRRELLGDGVHLLAGALGPPGVVEAFGFVELVAQLAEPLLVGRLRRRIENRQAVAGL